jgi:hypothetical protein
VTTSHESVQWASSPLRLEIAAHPHSGHLAGSWWPRSRDLQTELSELVEHFPPEVGRVGRVIFSRPDWASRPHKVRVRNGYLKTGSFPGDDTHVIVLTLATGSRLRLLVVPPETPAAVAQELFAASVLPANRRTGVELLDAARSVAPQAR